MVVASATLASGKAVPVLWQVNAQQGGGFVVELSNEWGVRKLPCDHQTLDPVGAATVVLELREAANGATEWISGERVHAGALQPGDTLTVTVAPGNSSFVEFGPVWAPG